ncbi:hypothetical protein SAMN02746089_01918 [Caldanaerobius fijiensis DSM 17918]|uniref:DUF4190 domain-containing protein n=1 Tax=Caldanaerobius fijiensis DSM 17918 TaxID=1121256 RepID=A0A1M5BNH3_9THEO|nr:hypothetical protein [Caldanaerobius fijiensis]SHF43752.1 hypothetical protein SAMN02746089_01918 [Caldanaerobius fijiensis DSM 17918]
MKKVTNKVKAALYGAITSMMIPVYAYANSNSSSIPDTDPNDLGGKIISTINLFLLPIGAGLIFISVAIIAVKLIMQHSKVQERAETLAGLGWLAAGALLLGGASLVAGLYYHLASNFK